MKKTSKKSPAMRTPGRKAPAKVVAKAPAKKPAAKKKPSKSPAGGSPPIKPLRLIQAEPGSFSLGLVCGTTKVDALIEELGHEPNGPFWDGIAELLIATEAPTLEDKFDFDSEGGMFVALGDDRRALEKLGALIAEVANDAKRLRGIMAKAKEMDFEFDD